MTSFDQVNLLRTQLNTLKQRDSRFQTFGASQHRYLLNPAITAQEVSDFEQKHSITLPEDYRNILLFIGNGGAGPYYGLFPLHCYNWELDNLQKDFLSRPFPHQGPWQPGPNSIEEHNYFENSWTQGAMRICHFGCDAYFLLVVSGPERGNIWIDDRASDYGITPWGGNFFTWYETWLVQVQGSSCVKRGKVVRRSTSTQA